MKRLKQYIGLVFLLFLFVGCSKNEQSGTNQTTKETQSSEAEEKMTDKDYEKIVGEWECIDPDWPGDKVYIRKMNDGIAIHYEDETEYTAQCVTKSEEDMYYNFESSENETIYILNLKENGNIILNSGTATPGMEGLSKPMEYKRISE